MITATKIAVATAGALLTGAVAWQVARFASADDERGVAPGATLVGDRLVMEEAAAASEEPAAGPGALAATRTVAVPRAAVGVSAPPATPAASFGARLIDERTGEALADYLLRLEDATGGAETVRTDATGAFRTRTELALGDLTVDLVDDPATGERILRPANHALALLEASREEGAEPTRASSELTLAHDGRSATREVAVPAGPTWFLEIENPHDADLTGATAVLHAIAWEHMDNAAWTPLRDGETPWARFGAAARDHFSPDRTALEVRDASGLFAGSVRVEATRGAHEQRIEIGKRSVLHGRVVTEEGRPVAHQDIVLRVRDAKEAEVRAHHGLPTAFWTATIGSGTFHVDWVPPGAYALHLVVDGHEDLGQPVRLEPGVQERTFVVDAPEGLGTIHGTITSRRGGEAEASVSLQPVDPGETREDAAEEAEVPAVTARVHWNEDDAGGVVGHFAFGALPPGEYRLTPSTRSFLSIEPAELTVTVPTEADPGFVLRDDVPTRDLRFRALGRDADDAGAFLVRVVLDPDGPEPKLAVTKAEDVGLVRNVPLGRAFEWRVHAPGRQPVWGDQEAFARGDEIEVALEPGWGTLLIVRDPGGTPAVGTEVFFDGRRVGATGPAGTLRATAPEKPRTIRLVHSVDGEVRYVEETDHELRDLVPTIHVILEEGSADRRER